MKGFCGGAVFFILFSFVQNASAQKVYGDLFVFRSGNSVYSLNKLKDYSSYLKDFQCFYPESLSAQYFKGPLSTPENYFERKSFKKNNETQSYKEITEKFVGLIKMVRYASSQSVSVNSDLPKAFKMSAKKNKCSLKGFEGEELREEMRNLALLEVFLRSRFLPGNSADITERQKLSILKNVRSLEESVKKQIEHELFEY